MFPRNAVFRAMESPWFVRAVARMRAPACATVLMHRFITSERRIGRHDPRKLRKLLASLRAADVALVSLEDAVQYCESNDTPRPPLAVSFTVDDGYTDFADVAWPVFREFDCPVSLFVVPDVVNGHTWFWWDKLDWLLRHAPEPRLQLEVEGRPFTATWHDTPSRIAAHERLADFCKQLQTEAVSQQIGLLADHWGLVVPVTAPEEYQVLSWEQLRTLENQGVRIGPHTMTHPVLGRCTDQQVRLEITQSVSVLREKLATPLPVFCYPNGTADDQGPREWALVKSTGLPYAITTSSGLMQPSVARSGSPQWRYRLPRIGYAEQAGRIIREFLA